jgi:hypothetical protein
MTSPLDDNLSALAQLDAASLGWVHRAEGAGTLVVESHGDDVRLIASDGRSLRLHSARDPRREADAQVAQALGDRAASVVAIVGAGAGFSLEVLESRLDTRVLVVEPTRALALAWLARRSWRTLIDAGRLRLLVGPVYAGSAGASQFLGGAWTHLPVVVNPVLLREAPAEVARARDIVDRTAREALQNADARSRFEDVACRNTISNLTALLREGDAASLAEAFRGRPAIVLGAGPSLNANAEMLRPLQSSCLIVAADTAVVPCVKGGLTPHLAVALDPSPANARHLTRTVVPESVHLVCEASIDPSVPRAFPGRTFFFRVGRHAPWPWLESAGLSLGILDAWGSVVTSALDVAVRAGCSPILFAGLDLAFTGGAPYCRQTALDDIWTWWAAAGDRLEDLYGAYTTARPVVLERAIEGGDTRTAAHLVTFRDWIRDYAAARPHVRFVNVTGAGILHGTGIEAGSLADLASVMQTANAPTVADTVRGIRAAARPTAREADVIARLSRVSPLELLQGHSEPSAAAARIAVAELTNRTVSAATDPAAAAVHHRSPEVPAAGPAPGTPLWLPDAARALRALDPSHQGAFAAMGPLEHSRTRECLGDALEAVRAVLLQDLNGTEEAAFRDSRADAWSDVPAAVLVQWPADVRPLVETATAALHEALRRGGWPIRLDQRPSAYFMAPADPRIEGTVTGWSGEEGPPRRVHVGLDALTWQWARVAAAALDTDAAIGRFVSCVRAACPPLLPSPRASGGLRLWLASAGSPGRTDGVPVVPFLHDRAVMRASTGLLTLDPASLSPSTAASIAPSAFHLFALPEPWRPDGDSWRTRHVPWSVIAEPQVLTDGGLRACRLATRLNETQALLTAFDGSGSYVVDGRGRLGHAEAWPRRVDGEITCGRSGRLAWSWDGARHLLFRAAPGAPALAWELPVAPMHALDDGEGSALLATTAGLWRWRADSGPRPATPGPELVTLHRRGMDVRAYPVPTVRGDGSRLATTRAFDSRDGTAAFVERQIAAGEACFSSSTQGPWTADTRFDASAVRISHVSGAAFWLACSGPRSAAWAGRSLVVTLLGQGDVLLFRDLLDLVEPLVAVPTA